MISIWSQKRGRQVNRISEHISYKEVIRSQTAVKKGIKNIPNPFQLVNIIALAINIFEPLRVWAGVKIYISSFFRAVLLNTVIGGSAKSDHCALRDRAAIDVDADVFGGKSNKELFEYVRDNLEFDKLIWEFGDDENPDWVHISYSRGVNRKIILRAYRTETGTKYIEL